MKEQSNYLEHKWKWEGRYVWHIQQSTSKQEAHCCFYDSILDLHIYFHVYHISTISSLLCPLSYFMALIWVVMHGLCCVFLSNGARNKFTYFAVYIWLGFFIISIQIRGECTIPSSAEVWLLYLIEIICHTSALVRKRTHVVFGGDLEVTSQSKGEVCAKRECMTACVCCKQNKYKWRMWF
jgi:hypothetical protein